MLKQQPKTYTMMPVPAETVTSTDLAEAVRIATARAQETKTPYGIFVNLDHLASFGKGIDKSSTRVNQASVVTNKSSMGVNQSSMGVNIDCTGISYTSMEIGQPVIGIIKPCLEMNKSITRHSGEHQDGHLEEQRSILELASEINRLTQLVCRDPMTGLYNYRYLRQRLSTEFKRAKRDHQPLCCAMIDVDRFKMINDTYGHPAGDCALRSLGFFLRRKLRETDVIARYGGDEFCILFPNTFFDKALMVMNKICRQTAGHLFRIDAARVDAANTNAASTNGASINAASINAASMKGNIISMSISFGLASIPDDDICQPAQLIELADKSLYQAKNTHHNQAGVP